MSERQLFQIYNVTCIIKFEQNAMDVTRAFLSSIMKSKVPLNFASQSTIIRCQVVSIYDIRIRKWDKT